MEKAGCRAEQARQGRSMESAGLPEEDRFPEGFSLHRTGEMAAGGSRNIRRHGGLDKGQVRERRKIFSMMPFFP